MLINLHVVGKAGAVIHIGEIQLVHAQLFNTRETLPGHEIYGRVRNSLEIMCGARSFLGGSRLFAMSIVEIPLPSGLQSRAAQ